MIDRVELSHTCAALREALSEIETGLERPLRTVEDSEALSYALSEVAHLAGQIAEEARRLLPEPTGASACASAPSGPQSPSATSAESTDD